MQLVILDRDGVINEEPDEGIHSATDWKPVRGSLEAIARLKHAGWKVVVAMNQPVTSGQDIESLIRINEAMQRKVRESGGLIEATFFCPHTAAEGCDCHKPGPGLLRDICIRQGIRPGQACFIGDALHDMMAARSAGVHPVLVKTGKGFGTVGMTDFDTSIPVYDDLYEAVDALLSRATA
jgi:D-glycero-D-manno-heptose 1,7-bisphosphate phosphatase